MLHNPDIDWRTTVVTFRDALTPRPPVNPKSKHVHPQVLHIPDVDWRTTTVTFRDALTQIKAWSAANPAHTPLTVYVEFVNRKNSVASLIEASGNLDLFNWLLSGGERPRTCEPPKP